MNQLPTTRPTAAFVVAVLLINAAACAAIPTGSSDEQPLLRFMKAGKWGFLDHEGNVVVEPRYDMVYEYTELLALVQVDNLHGFVDETGTEVIEPRYERALNFTEGMAAVSIGGKWGYVDRNGRIVIEPHYEMCWQFSDGLASVRMNNRGGYIDHDGNLIIDLRYSWAGNFADGVAPVIMNGQGMAVIDKTGKILIGPGLAYAGKPGNGMIPVHDGTSARFVDHDNRTLIELPDSVSIADPFSDGLAKVNQGEDRYGMFSRWGYVDRQGKLVIEHRFDEATDFSEGLAAVNFSNSCEMDMSMEEGSIKPRGNWGYIGKKGNTVIEPQFNSAHSFRNGIAFVIIGEDAGYIDTSGKLLWNLQ